MSKTSNVEDYIVFIRFIAGVFMGLIAYIIYKTGFNVVFFDTPMTIWFIAGVVYVITIYLLQSKPGVTGFFRLFLRGLLTFYGTWILVFLVLYDLLG
ncbi:MAG: hypothetical protein ABWW65_03205 [Thermoprotei archaeon]